MTPTPTAEEAAAKPSLQAPRPRAMAGDRAPDTARVDHVRDNSMGVHRTGFRPPARTRIFTGLDIGTTKICAIIGEIDPTGRTTIRGVASTPSQGLRRGVVVDLEETVNSIRTAVRKA